jgi:hypothetical protein
MHDIELGGSADSWKVRGKGDETTDPRGFGPVIRTRLSKSQETRILTRNK